MATKFATTFKALPPVVREALSRCTPQQQRFVMAYCGTAAGNGTLAMHQAGAKGDYSSRAAQASDALRHEGVRAAIEAWMTTYAMAASEVTHIIADMTRCSLEPFLEMDKQGRLVLRKQTDEVWSRHAHWIKQVETDPKSGKVTKLQVHDRTKAADLMAKILKLYSDAPQVNLFLYLQSLSDDELIQEYERTVTDQALDPVRMN